MITYSIIKKSQLEGALRLDAEFYCAPSDFKNDFLLGKDIIGFVQYGTSKELNEDNKGFPVLRLNEFDELFINTPAKYCDLINKDIFNSLKLRKGDVLVCRTNGNPKLVGKSAIVMEDTETAFASYLFRIQPKKDVISSESLCIFLNSRTGRSQIEKFLMPSIQSNFSPAQFKAIKIPILPKSSQDQINNYVKESYSLRNQSNNLYSQAEQLLLKELGFKDFQKQINSKLWNIVNFADIWKVNRMDAEYFQSKYEKLLLTLKSKGAQFLEDVIENVSANFSPESDQNYNYVELSNINSSIGIIDRAEEILGKEAPSRARRALREGDVVVSSVEGSLEKVALVDKDQDSYLASTGFFQFRSSAILPEVLLVLAKSIIFNYQLKQRCAGTILTAVPKESIKDILIPVLEKSIQTKIAKLVRESHVTRKKSKELLEEAKRKVEEMIESQNGTQ